ncbi:alpha/beta hydrolase [Hydrogenophaga sp. PAMC20947]|uniref:alpha/beta hydrolase n=1 Tax=Hydrogenophaga sp. PAMC20947 TaxID=2565558 RepID=UPI001B34E614|nr:alpha/beta hydrolase [Hydrogenophaga sp. PAMC20947]
MRILIPWALSALLLAGCSTLPSASERQAHAMALASSKGWLSSHIPAGDFDLVAYAPPSLTAGKPLTVYIEGDGFAWISGTQPSTDPTPRDPLALRLALAQPAGHAVYLARPCQYVNAAQSGCAQRYWTEARFAPEVIHAMNLAIDDLKQRFNVTKLVLVGYSGGAAVAALVAARRTDVARLITVAGNLDHRAWTSYHRVRALDVSLNAADSATLSADLPQTHFLGGHDRVMPPALARKWPVAFTGLNASNLRIVEDADHACCWADRWPALLGMD